MFTPADTLSLGIFELLLLTLMVLFFAVIGRAQLDSKKIATGLILWLMAISGFTLSGWALESPFPRLIVFIVLSFLPILIFSCSSLGKQIADSASLQALVGFQIFRLPLELVLHHWANIGTIPTSMTWTGQNWDIITGILALVITPFAHRSRTLVIVFNGIGFLLLLNVVRVAILSSPFPFAWQVEPPLQLALYFPYSLILPICVGGALAGHIILARKLGIKS